MRRSPFISVTLLAATVALLSACALIPAQKMSPVDDLDRFNLLGPDLLFDPKNPPAGWVRVGSVDLIEDSVSVSRQRGVPALKLTTGPSEYMLVRKLDADLIVSPFLDWFWLVDAHGGKTHPVKLVIGFEDPAQPSLGSPFGGLLEGLPLHNRTLHIAWSDLGFMGGHLEVPTQRKSIPVYTPRGGPEQQRRWWRETIDLDQLYRKAWPRESTRDVRLVFIGLLVERHVPSTHAFISGLVLSR